MTITTLASFDGIHGRDPAAALFIDSAGNLIGTTLNGGTSDVGVIFELQKSGAGYDSVPTVLASLTEGVTGGIPGSSAVADAAGNLIVSIYGGGPSGYGTVLELARQGTGYAAPAVLAAFDGQNGGYVGSGVVIDGSGNVFGASWAGGVNHSGSLYEIAGTGGSYASTPAVIASFNGTNGLYPNELFLDSAGNLLGTTVQGGTGSGVLFEIQKTAGGYASMPTVLFTFDGTNGAWPITGLVADAAGDLFGTTQLGGSCDLGVIFELARTADGYASAPSILFNFDRSTGTGGLSKLTIDAAGDLFGEAFLNNSDGTVFKLAKTAAGYASQLTVVAELAGVGTGHPSGGLTADAAGNLFGVTLAGGASGKGSIFEISGAGYVLTRAETVADALSSPPGGSILIQDSIAAIGSHLDTIASWARAGHVSSIALTDSLIPSLSLSSSQFAADIDALSAISTPFSISFTDGASPTLFLSSSQVMADLPALEAIATPYSIHLTDPASPTLTLTSVQAVAAAKVLAAISSDYSAILQPVGLSDTIAGIPNAQGNTVSFILPANSYTVSSAGGKGALTVAEGSDVTDVSAVQALHFSDATVIVASPTAAAPGAVSSAQVTEMYGAVFGRLPDAGGLAFYEAYAASHPSTPLLDYAEWFLSSPEYANNSAHAYPQTMAGNQQFIADSYQNLLHRAPSAAETSFYQDNVIAPALKGLAAGTVAYSAAELAAHAQVLVYFSQSPEFLGDVQITAQNPAGGQHWLMLV